MGWATPVIALQWLIAWRIFVPNWKAVVFPTLLGGTYYSLADMVAVRSGIWFFDENQILGIRIANLPMEESLFFFVTSLIVSQSFVMLLPDRFRHPPLPR